jgi:hypothetical protein
MRGLFRIMGLILKEFLNLLFVIYYVECGLWLRKSMMMNKTQQEREREIRNQRSPARIIISPTYNNKS